MQDLRMMIKEGINVSMMMTMMMMIELKWVLVWIDESMNEWMNEWCWREKPRSTDEDTSCSCVDVGMINTMLLIAILFLMSLINLSRPYFFIICCSDLLLFMVRNLNTSTIKNFVPKKVGKWLNRFNCDIVRLVSPSSGWGCRYEENFSKSFPFFRFRNFI